MISTEMKWTKLNAGVASRLRSQGNSTNSKIDIVWVAFHIFLADFRSIPEESRFSWSPMVDGEGFSTI